MTAGGLLTGAVASARTSSASTCGLAVALPRPASTTDALLAPPAGDRGREGVAALAGRLRGELASLAADLPSGAYLRIDAAKVMQVRQQPELCGAVSDTGSFAPSPRLCRRAVGTAAVTRCVRSLTRTPAAAVAEVLAAGVDDATRPNTADPSRLPWWATWYSQLSLGGRTAVAADAVTWATQLFSAFEWTRFDRPPVIGGRDDWWQSPGGRLALQGRVEVRAQLDGASAYAVMAGGWCDVDWRVRLGFPALVCLLARGERALPCRVVGIWPASGQVRVLPVDVSVLSHVADAVLAVAGTLIDARIEAAAVGTSADGSSAPLPTTR